MKPGFVFRRGKIWWVARYGTGPDGKRREIRRSTGIEVRGEDIPDEVVGFLSGSLDRACLPDPRRTTFADVEKCLKMDYQLHGRRSWPAVESCLKHLRPFFGPARPAEYHPRMVKEYQRQRLSGGAARATADREVAYLNRALSLAFEEGLLESRLSFGLLGGGRTREGVLEPDEFYRIVQYLPEDYQDFLEFLFLSCWRAGRARSLAWDRVSLDSLVPGIQPESGNGNKKTGEFLPLLGESGERTRLFAILERRGVKRKEGCPWVFHVGGEPVGDIRKAWSSACARAGLKRFLMHDLRRSGAVHLSNAGVPEKVIMARAGWKTRSMFDRYRVVSAKDLARANVSYEKYIEKENFHDQGENQ